ncbi:MAG: SMC-Scp complex subunit ScpB, partial [bacterium]|nr:SMC-Scp complex subunit ScpB [bacterium]
MSELSDTDKSADPEVSSCAKAPADGSESADESAGEVGSSSETEMAATVEAILFSTDAPITAAKILQVAELPTKRAVTAAIENLNARYEASGASFRIENIAGGYRFQTLEAYHDVLSRLFKAKSESKLSQPAMETLSIVAYRQPVLRADIESIRGVA